MQKPHPLPLRQIEIDLYEEIIGQLRQIRAHLKKIQKATKKRSG